MKLRSLIVLLALALPATSCTEAQWRRFQEINSTLANYVNDGVLALSIVRGFVEGLVAPADRGTVSDVFSAIQACNEALQTEASVVQESHSPLDTPGHVAASFPAFIRAWNDLMGSLHAHGMNMPTARPGAHHGIRTPRIVAAAGGAL